MDRIEGRNSSTYNWRLSYPTHNGKNNQGEDKEGNRGLHATDQLDLRVICRTLPPTTRAYTSFPNAHRTFLGQTTN